jgi:photosystem II stability/assembly factor-like uncharacterized protein
MPVGNRSAWVWTAANALTEPFAQSVALTTNGGRTWREVAPRELRVARDSSVIGTVDFLSAHDAWIMHGTIEGFSHQTLMATQDRGRSWATVGPLPARGCQVQFITPEVGWCVFDSGAGGAAPVIVYRTVDGGRRWMLMSRSSSPTGPPATPGSLPLGCDKQITFLTLQRGWTSFVCAAGVSPLYETLDGGRTWLRRQVRPPPAAAAPASGYAANWLGSPLVQAQYGAAVLDSQTTAGSVTLIYTTHDGGRSWTPARLPGAPRDWTVDLLSPSVWKLFNETTILTSTNAGRSWQSTRSEINLARFTTIGFTSLAHGWAQMSSGDTYRTTDSGARWQRITIPTP